MATTAIFAVHKGKGRSVAKALRAVRDYMADPAKTDDGEYISSYECAPETADIEFSLATERYKTLTGRDQGERAVIAYSARQSFAPGEITPAEANRLGYELAQRFTKGRFAYIVCTHVNRAHIHNHIVWSSVRLDCKRKFRNFFRSAFALRRCSDILCAENGYSVIQNPGRSPGRDYAKHVYGGARPPSFQARLKEAIDNALAHSPATFDEFISLIRAAGVVAERRGKHMRVKLPEQKQFARLYTIGGDYTEEAIRERISGRRIVPMASAPAGKGLAVEGRGFSAPVGKGSDVHGRGFSSSAGKYSAAFSADISYVPSMLIDIESKMREGKGKGFQRWASVQNLKQMARTLIYLQERGLDDYAVLKEKTAAATARFNELSDRLKDLEARLTANATLQKHIVTYTKTRATYVEYRKAGYSKSFKETHEAEILLHQTAKKAFDELGYGKGKRLPTVATLRAEYAPVLEEKKRTYTEFRKARDEMKELLVAKSNVDRLLNITDDHDGRGHEKPEL